MAETKVVSEEVKSPVVTAQEYRKKTKIQKDHTVPSGAVFRIKAVNPMIYASRTASLVKFLEIDEKQEYDEEKTREKILKNIDKVDMNVINESMKDVLIHGIISPKVVDKSVKRCADDELSVHELLEEYQDAVSLYNEILFLSNKKRDSFFLSKKTG